MKNKLFIMLCVLSILLCSCGSPANTDAIVEEIQTAEIPEIINEPDLSQIRSICDLATLECYYHNVAKLTKSKGTGLTHLGEKERTLWIEYTGVAKIGIDMSEVTMSSEGTNITITIPNAKLITYKVDTISKDNYISTEDAWLNKNPITADEQTQAVNEAQEEMKASVENNTSLLVRAQERAKKLIENYILQLGDATGIKYSIKWMYEDSSNTSIDVQNSEA